MRGEFKYFPSRKLLTVDKINITIKLGSLIFLDILNIYFSKKY